MKPRVPFSAAALRLLTVLLTANALPVRAQDFTLDAMLDSLRRGATVVNLAAIDAAAARQLDSTTNLLRGAGAGVLSLKVRTLAEVITSRRTRFSDANRWDPRATDALAQPWFRGAILSLAKIANGTLADSLERKAPQESKGLLAPTDSLGRAVRELASQQGTERLRRLEIKYGSGSPQLNVVEATVNYVFQWVPGLRSGADGSPNRHEFLAAYRTVEVATAGAPTDGPHLVSAGQIGMRWYHWRRSWGQGSARAQLLRPRYASAGLYVLGDDVSPLKFPSSADRLGAFVGWGALHVAYVFDGDGRLFVGTDKLLVPHLF